MDLVLLGRRDLHQRSFSALKRSLSLSAALPLFTREREVINSDLKPLDGLSGQRTEGTGLRARRRALSDLRCRRNLGFEGIFPGEQHPGEEEEKTKRLLMHAEGLSAALQPSSLTEAFAPLVHVSPALCRFQPFLHVTYCFALQLPGR